MELIRKPASASNNGELESSAAQTISGAKTFTGAITASAGIVGKTDGAAIATGLVGEIIPSTLTTSSVSAATLSSSFATHRTLTLTKGKYIITGWVEISNFGGNPGRFNVSTAGTAGGTYALFNSTYVSANIIPQLAVSVIADIISDGTVTMRITSTGGSLTGTCDIAGAFMAVRIA